MVTHLWSPVQNDMHMVEVVPCPLSDLYADAGVNVASLYTILHPACLMQFGFGVRMLDTSVVKQLVLAQG